MVIERASTYLDSEYLINHNSRSFNTVNVILKYSYPNRRLVEDNEILFYTTDRYICDYDFITGIRNVIRNTYGGLIYTQSPRKYFLLKGLKYSHGGKSGPKSNSVFDCDMRDVVEMDALQVERDLKIKEILS